MCFCLVISRDVVCMVNGETEVIDPRRRVDKVR